MNTQRRNVWHGDFGTQLERQTNGPLRVDLRGEKFECGGSNTKWLIVPTKFLQAHGLAHGLFPEPSAPLKRLRRASHALLGQLVGEDRSACGTRSEEHTSELQS